MSLGVLSRPAPCHVGNTPTSAGEKMTEQDLLVQGVVLFTIMAFFGPLMVVVYHKASDSGDKSSCRMVMFFNAMMVAALALITTQEPVTGGIVSAVWFVPQAITWGIIQLCRERARI